MVSTATISQFVEGVSFPATKDDCIDYARRKNAPEDVLELLKRFPEGTYYSMAALWEALDETEE